MMMLMVLFLLTLLVWEGVVFLYEAKIHNIFRILKTYKYINII